MIKLDLQNLLFPIGFLDLKYWYKAKQSIRAIKQKYNAKELWFIDLDINNDIDKINDFVNNNKDKYDDVVILWIWGSALWTRSIFTALKWKYYNLLPRKKRDNFPRLHILDNVDPLEIDQLIEVLDYKKTLFISISKSWWTLETVSQFQFFKNELEKLWLNYTNHFVVVAWEDSKFKKESLKKWLKVFDIPNNVWGRFSVFTNVWLLPLALVWIDIKLLFAWFNKAKIEYLNEDISKNKALLTSLIQYHSYIELWKNITVFFPYISNFNYLWQWYKQMIWESLGKSWIWVTLSDSIWVTDQHSQLQLYYDWPNDKLIMFLELEDFEKDYYITKDKKISFSDLMFTEKYWTESSITDYNKINYTLKLDKLNEKTLWELILFLEFQTAILWELYCFDAFDQPWVEIWKKITKQKLLEKFGKIDILEWKIN